MFLVKIANLSHECKEMMIRQTVGRVLASHHHVTNRYQMIVISTCTM